ncbi:uncharacterized protein SPAPADRAFT_54879 [Spathaspora passalidarum NRRL Y-27907]|uniref:DNA topoisomerase (ATP-hydrolyzing) n=1 Tax=Spathaspora passalidarum (strain NRRL Y-27907 / 11-Y1) TaxID=619300 RepID=G3AKD8_SPAPN|nr:uncharacterized protein SPAPADRAFT_54879 [Spathaspora passalidarum NRRL Y-27907]EGW32895.1 hypothetical protein SPAPADRAFT_54879 [Spathaspora passalidarum NRRL Y-27907]
MSCIYIIDSNTNNYQPVTIVLYKTQSNPSSKTQYRKTQTYTQFSSNIAEIQKFAALVKTIRILYQHAKNGNHTTVRDIYYHDVELFSRNQTNCTRLLELIVEDSLQWSLEKDLNIRPSQKGMMYADWNNSLHTTEPILIPVNYQHLFSKEITDNQKLLIIVIEKDAVFQSFCQYLKSHNTFQNFVVITGKGFPDRLTMRFLAWLTESFSSLTIGFFDSDVYGLRICQQYQKCGSNLIFGGVFLLETNIRNHLPITTRDIKLMMNLLNELSEKGNQEKDNLFETYKRELTRGLTLFRKAEMNVLKFATELNYYINEKSRQSQ